MFKVVGKIVSSQLSSQSSVRFHQSAHLAYSLRQPRLIQSLSCVHFHTSSLYWVKKASEVENKPSKKKSTKRESSKAKVCKKKLEEEISLKPTGPPTMRILSVAEKNDAAKNIARILSGGASTMRNGLSQYNKVYEFDINIPSLGGNCKMSFTSVSGHVMNYDFTASHRGWNSCDPMELFDAPLVKKCTGDMEKVKANIEQQARYANALIIWTDCDREGENIGWEVVQIVQQVKPGIPVHRARFSEITNISIRRAIANLTELDIRSAKAVDVRQMLDLRIGAAFTRFQTLTLQKKLPQLPSSTSVQSIVSFGTCQFPTLTLVVERYLEREEFIINPFWYIEMTKTRSNLEVTFKWQRNRLYDINECLQIYQKVMTEAILATVCSITTKPKSKWRPLPMDTVLFEKLSSSKLRIPAKQAMKIAEKLYTSGWISYPRTETNIFPKELNLTPIVEAQTSSNVWGAFASKVLENGINPRQGKNTDNAHPPIYPTKLATNLNGDEYRIYELISRHFLACISADAKGSETEILVDIRGEKFHTSGLIIFERNYLDVYPYEKWNASEIPKFTENEQFRPDSLFMKEGKTTPPSLLTESDLITLMEKHGIGTDATHAEHIETIKERKYVTLTNDRRFKPLPLGLGLVQAYKKIREEVAKPQLRALMERDIQAICSGTKESNDVLRTQIHQYKSVFNQVLNQCNVLLDEVTDTFSKYPDGCHTENDPPSDDDDLPPPPPPPFNPGNNFHPPSDDDASPPTTFRSPAARGRPRGSRATGSKVSKPTSKTWSRGSYSRSRGTRGTRGARGSRSRGSSSYSGFSRGAMRG